MNKKNVAKIAIFLILLTCLIGAVNASEDVSTDTINTADGQTTPQETTHEDTNKEIVSEPTQKVSEDTPKETTKKETQTKLKTTNTETNNNTNNNEETTKTSTTTTPKDDKKLKAQNNQEPLKSGTKTVYVNSITELTTAINSAVQDSENDTYIINLNEGNYQITSNTNLNSGTYTPNIIINANKQTLSSSRTTLYIKFNNLCNITINDATITTRLQNYNKNLILNNIILNNEITNNANMNLKILNSTLDTTIRNTNGILIISDDTIFEKNFQIAGTGKIIINDTSRIAPYLTSYNGNYILANITISTSKNNNGNLTIKNSTIDTRISNYGNLTIDDDCIVTNNFKITGPGKIYTNNTNVINALIAQNIYIKEYSFENTTITSEIVNYGNLTIKNSTLSANIENYGILSIINISMTSSQISNYGKVTIKNSTINGKLYNWENGIILLNDTVVSQAITNKKGNNLTIINSTIAGSITNNGNLTLDNSTLNGQLSNDGYVFCNKSTLNTFIQNDGGTVRLSDDNIFGENFFIAGRGTVIADDMDKILPYLTVLEGNYTFENRDIKYGITNYGNITIRNSNIRDSIFNYGNLTLQDLTLNIHIRNSGTLIIGDDTIFGTSFSISGNGQIIINDTTKLAPYLDNYYGTYIVENITINNQRTNEGNLTFRNVTINTVFTNNGNLTLENSTINAQITNNGNLTISDNVIFGAKSSISGNGQIITNDFNKILPYITTYNGDYLLENLTINSKTNNGNLTIRNSTTTGSITNNGNLTIENSKINNEINNNGKLIIKNTTVNKKIQNKGTIIFGDNVTFGNNFQITVSGENVYIDDYSKIFKYLPKFYYNATVELGDYQTNHIYNYGNLTIKNSQFNKKQVFNYGNLTIINSSTTQKFTNYNGGTLEFINSTINAEVNNNGILIISEDTILGPNFKLTGNGEILTNNTQLIDYVQVYKGNIELINKTITTPKTNQGTLTLTNCTINSTISNSGIIIIDENTVFGENAKITGNGKIIINDISKILPIIDTINGNYEITDTSLTKKYAFIGEITLINCTITNPDNTNFGKLYLSNCTVNVGEDKTFITNYGTLTISKDTNIIGKIVNLVDNGVIYEGAPKTYLVTQDTIGYFFDETGLTSIVNPGDTLNIQGKILLNQSLIINKPVNIISTTNDGYINLNTTAGNLFGDNPGNRFAITKEGSYTNVTGIYFHNTQLWLYNTHHVTLDHISAVVENQRVGSGVGQTSIRANSTYITVKNSEFYTCNNGGSSTLVLAWADYCTIENNTIEGNGNVGNLLYLTTYNVNIPTTLYNAHNKLINNKLIGPESAAICYGICISGYDNLIENNTITYTGTGITFQWGSGVNGIEQSECLFGSGGNIVRNNTLYGGCGIRAGDIICDNYMEGILSVPENSTAYNNIAKGLQIAGSSSNITNNLIFGNVTFAKVNNVIIANNSITGNITIPSTTINNLITENDIIGSIELDGSFNNITNNTIITDDEYTISSKMLGQNNNITGNYLVAKGKCGDATVDLRDSSNVIKNNNPIGTIIELAGPSETTVNKETSITITLKDKNGNIINDGTISISSSLGSENATLTNGAYIYKYTATTVGEDTITVTYKGNNQYYTNTSSTKIKVIAEPVKPENKTPEKDTSGNITTQPQTPTTQAPTTTKLDEKAQEALEQKLPAKQISITAKKTTTVSKKAKKLTLKATLKVKGKKVNKRTVKFIIKGKTYKAKTNKKGVATLKLNKKQLTKILKNVKPGKKFTYKIRYGKKTVKKSLKIKK